MEPCYLTAAGLERARQRLSVARAAFRAVCADNPKAAESGDSSVWHDNFAYEENQRLMHMHAKRVRELESILDRAVVVDPAGAPSAVTVGARVVFRVEETGELRTLVVAGFDDGDARSGRVSYNSPLGRHLVGAATGERVEVLLGGARREIEIVEINGAVDA